MIKVLAAIYIAGLAILAAGWAMANWGLSLWITLAIGIGVISFGLIIGTVISVIGSIQTDASVVSDKNDRGSGSF
jgi:hypothetical protein